MLYDFKVRPKIYPLLKAVSIYEFPNESNLAHLILNGIHTLMKQPLVFSSLKSMILKYDTPPCCTTPPFKLK